MTIRRLELQRDLDLPPVIVWDALIDPVLVSGWLGEARIDPVPGGGYDLDWVGGPEFAATDGVIVLLDEPAALTVRTSAHGVLTFRLKPHGGGSRGDWTELLVLIDVDVDDAFAERITGNWTRALTQLEELLRGHPVDWAPRAVPQSTEPAVVRPVRHN